jgi:MFS family permease
VVHLPSPLESRPCPGLELANPHGALRLNAVDPEYESLPVDTPTSVLTQPGPSEPRASEPRASEPRASEPSASAPLAIEIHGYDRIFWLAYLSNGLTTMANAMLVRYADFVDSVGGEERQLGLIIGCGMIGSILTRLAQGDAIDRYGAARVWLWSSVLYSTSLLLHLTVTTAFGPWIFLVRLLMQASLAGFFGSSITFVSLRVPPHRMGEMVGALGTSGFIGIMLGPLLGDLLAGGGTSQKVLVLRLFATAITLALSSTLATCFVTRDLVRSRHRRRPNLWHVVARYHPFTISITAAAMGAGFSIPLIFLRPFTIESNLNGVGLFFFVYASVAFIARLATRAHFSRLGNRVWITAGLALLSFSFLCYLPVTREWHLIVPATIAGIAHALLFPSIMAAGTSAFPRRYLGVATSLILAMFDLGAFFGAPVIGAFLREAKQHTTAAYPLMFAGTAIVLGSVTLLFCFSTAAKK